MSGQGAAGCRCGCGMKVEGEAMERNERKYMFPDKPVVPNSPAKFDDSDMENFEGFIQTFLGGVFAEGKKPLGKKISVDCLDKMLGRKLMVDDKPKYTKKEYPEDVRFTYYGKTGFSHSHGGILVVASRVNEKEKAIFYGSAWCSPEDVYNKETGKSIAWSDLDNNLWVADLGKKKHHEINARILAALVASNEAPSWGEEMVAFELVNHLMNAYKLEDYLF